MSFEDTPEDREECYPCEECADGNVTKDEDGYWSCDNCNFTSFKDDELSDDEISLLDQGDYEDSLLYD